MTESTLTFEQGEPIDVGSHGAHDYVYESGTPVSDNGDSTLVFESGNGLGGLRAVFYDLSPDGFNWSDTQDPEGLDRAPKVRFWTDPDGGYFTTFHQPSEPSSNESYFGVDTAPSSYADTPAPSGYDFVLLMEDGGDGSEPITNSVAYDDCDLYWREPDGEPYIEIALVHSESFFVHDVYLGEGENYLLDAHDGEGADDDGSRPVVSDYAQVAEVRMWDNGDVTDLNNNLLGTWT